MATNPVNLVDAIAETSTRDSRNRSAVLRVGVVTAVGANGFATVTVGGGSIPVAYHYGTQPFVGDVVTLVNDRDMWVIVGAQATTAFPGGRPTFARTGTVTAVGTNGTLTATVSGVSITATYHQSAKPSVGDTVTLLNERSTWLVVGAQAATAYSGKVLGYQNQISAPPFTPTGSNVDFTGAAFPPITFTIPRSGRIKVTISGDIFNTTTASSTVWLTARCSVPALTLVGSVGLSAHGAGRLYGSKVSIWEDGPAGTSCTFTPQWNISSGTAATAQVTNGLIVIEALDL